MKNNTREYNIYDMTSETLYVYDVGNDTLEMIEDYPMDGTHMICAVITEDDVVDVTGDPDHETWIMRAVSKLVDIREKELIEKAFEYVIGHIMNLEDEEDEEDDNIDDTPVGAEYNWVKDYESSEENKSNNQLHPEHYNRGLEVIDFTNLYNLNGNEFNIIKYLLRYPFKGTPIEDLNKALNYTNFEIRRLENKESIVADVNRMINTDNITDEQSGFTHDFLMSWKPYFRENEWGFVSSIINDIENIHFHEVKSGYRLDVLYGIQNDIEDLIYIIKYE